MNVGEYGIVFNLNVNFDISGFTGLSLAFTKPDASLLTVTNPQVSVGSVPLTTPYGTFPANQYCIYTFAIGNINQIGLYSVRLTYTDTTKRLISDIVTFTVSP
jgi:hypothetical protein